LRHNLEELDSVGEVRDLDKTRKGGSKAEAKLQKKNAIVEYLDYQIPVTQLKGQRGKWRKSK